MEEIPEIVSKNIDGSKSNKLTITILIIAVMALFSIVVSTNHRKDTASENTITKLDKRIEYLDSCLTECGKESLKRERYRSDILDDRENTKNKLIEKLNTR